MKRYILLLTLCLAGCVSSPKPDVRLEDTESVGYKFEVWQREDGSKYMKNPLTDKVMDVN